MGSIREANRSDLDSIMQLNVELHEFSAAGVPSRLRAAPTYDIDAMREHVDKILRDPSAAHLVALDEDVIVGFAEIRIVEPDADRGVLPTRRGHLQSLVVTEERRGEGFGAQLLAAAESWARNVGAKEMDLDYWVFEGGPGEFYLGAGYQVISNMVVREL